MNRKFHSDGGTDLLSHAEEYARLLVEPCSILKNPNTGRFHVIRQYSVAQRLALGWVLYATVTVVVQIERHGPLLEGEDGNV